METEDTKESHTFFSFLDENRSFFLGIILILSAYLKFIYLFHYSSYDICLVSQMQTYWDAAVHSYYRGDFDPAQWSTLPTLGHVFLAWVFKLLYLAGLYPHKHEAIIGLNILLSTLDAALVYGIAMQVFASGGYALLVAAIYAFFFPITFGDALILPIHPYLFALLLGTYLMMTYLEQGKLYLFVSGVMIGIAAALRPETILMVIPFLLYPLFASDRRLAGWVRALVFGLGFGTTVLLVITQNNAVSSGKLHTLSADTAPRYLLEMCQKDTITSRSDIGTYTVRRYTVSPDAPIQEYNTTIPFTQPTLLLAEAHTCKKPARTLLQAYAQKLHRIYSDTLSMVLPPYHGSITYVLRFNILALWMTVLLVLLPFVVYDRHVMRSGVGLLIGTAAAQLIALFAFGVEPCFLQGFFYGVVILSVLSVIVVLSQFKQLWWKAGIYLLIVGGAIMLFYHL